MEALASLLGVRAATAATKSFKCFKLLLFFVIMFSSNKKTIDLADIYVILIQKKNNTKH